MTIALGNVMVKHERRIRLFFTNTLDAGAFDASHYVVTSNGLPQLTVVQAYVVANTPTCVELAFNGDLSQFGVYTLSALSVPALDASTTSATPDANNTTNFAIGGTVTPPNVESPDDDLDALVYNRDLVFDGNDIVETEGGGLATTQGLPNYQGAIQRRVVQSRPLPWAPRYGDHMGEFVNGPAPLASTAAAKARRQAYADDRTKSVSITFAPSATKPEEMVFQLAIVPIGAADGAPPVAVSLSEQ